MNEEITINLTRDELEALHYMAKNYMRMTKNPPSGNDVSAMKKVSEAVKQHPKEVGRRLPHTTASA